MSDRYQLGARVSGAVAGGWIAEWVDARRVGDQVRVDAAVSAMASHDWPILTEMEAEGAYPQVLWRYADAIGGAAVVGESEADIGSTYRNSLGCDG